MGETENNGKKICMFIMLMYTYVHVCLQTLSPWPSACVNTCTHTHVKTHKLF